MHFSQFRSQPRSRWQLQLGAHHPEECPELDVFDDLEWPLVHHQPVCDLLSDHRQRDNACMACSRASWHLSVILVVHATRSFTRAGRKMPVDILRTARMQLRDEPAVQADGSASLRQNNRSTFPHLAATGAILGSDWRVTKLISTSPQDLHRIRADFVTCQIQLMAIFPGIAIDASFRPLSGSTT